MSLTAKGFKRARLVDIRQAIITDLKSRLDKAGLPSDIETRPDSIFGLLIDTFAEREAVLWEVCELIYESMYPNTATGVSLDNAVSFTGVTRRKAEKSKGYVCFYGKQSGIDIPSGTRVRQSDIDQLWQTNKDGTISNLNASDVEIIPALGTGDYTVTINAKDYTYTAAATANLQQILTGLVAILSRSQHKISSNGAAVRITMSGVLTGQITLSSNLSFAEIGTQFMVESLDYTAEGAEIGAIDQLSQSIIGVTRVANIQVATAGRKTESDEELRTRYLNGEFFVGTATLPTFTYHIKNVLGVKEVAVFENKDNVTDNAGRPPHSVHCIVEGGLDHDIAQAIYKTKAAGISSHGAVSYQLSTNEGTQVICFDRPVYLYVTIAAVLKLKSIFDSEDYNKITHKLYKQGKNLLIGQNVLIQKFYRACYETNGVEHVELTIGASSDAGTKPTMGNTNITIGFNQKAVFDLSRINVS